LVMAPRGLSSMVGNMLVGKLIGRIDPRWLIAIGILLSALGVSVGTHYTANISTWWFIWPLLLQGFGLGMILVPLSTVAFLTLPQSTRAEAAGIYSLIRTIGSSVGIALTITLLARHTQIAWNQLGGFIQPYNLALFNYLQPLHLQLTDLKAAAILSNELASQAQMIAFIDIYKFLEWSFLAMLPLLLLLRRPSVVAEKVAK
jgi:DHA2 family multidrug resistance protein